MVSGCSLSMRICLLPLVLGAAVSATAGLAGCVRPDTVSTAPAAAKSPASRPAVVSRSPARAWFLPSRWATPSADTEHLRQNLRRVVAQSRDRVFPALVNIHVVTVDYYGGKEHKSRAVGSGTIISKEGYVLTNQHVTNDGKKFKCTLANEEEVPAEPGRRGSAD